MEVIQECWKVKKSEQLDVECPHCNEWFAINGDKFSIGDKIECYLCEKTFVLEGEEK